MDPKGRRETYCRQAALKLITFFHSKRYQSSGMLIHWKNSYVPRSKQRTGRREPANKIRKLSVTYIKNKILEIKILR
jgi:hypothetical protein